MKNRPEGALGHVSRVARDRNFSARHVTPHLVAARSRPIEQIASTSQSARHFPVPEPGQPSHYGTLMGTRRSSPVSGSTKSASAGGSGSPCSTHDSAIFLPGYAAVAAAAAGLGPDRRGGTVR